MTMPTNTQEHFDAVASNGARLLDAHAPGWFDNVSAEDLRLASTCDCVLGQLFGEYMEARILLGITAVEAANYGFTIPIPFNREPYWAELTASWRREIDRRKNAINVNPDGTLATSIPA